MVVCRLGDLLQAAGLLCGNSNTAFLLVPASQVFHFYLSRCINCRLFTFLFVLPASSLLLA